MSKGRLEAFSDGVIAIIITIMALELRPPHEATWQAIQPVIPAFGCYLVSFVFLGIYWNNHHHLLQAAKHVNGRVLWANLHLLFWLSIVPFVTAWVGQSSFAPLAVAIYGVILFCAAIAYYFLARSIVALHGENSAIAVALGRDFKGKISIVIYLAAILACDYSVTIACLFYLSVAILWLIPDRRIERTLSQK